MKKFLLITIFSIWAVTSFSQEYINLIDEIKTWNTLNIGRVGPEMWDTIYSTTTHKFFGDTVIDSFTYYKLYKSTEENPENWTFNYYMREDDDNKVWIKDDNEEETLLYDFNAEIGDTVFVGIYPSNLIVDSIGEIEINSIIRKKLWLTSVEMPEYYTETWIEGIGSSKGLIWSGSVQVVGGWNWFLCLSENEELIYMNPNYESCFLITGIENTEYKDVSIYPNPAKSTLNISGIDNIRQITIFSLDGQILSNFKNNFSNLNISNLHSGTYLIRIQTIDNNIWKNIIVSK